eukprot:2233781-Pyramimonas_sp.AAC.1
MPTAPAWAEGSSASAVSEGGTLAAAVPSPLNTSTTEAPCGGTPPPPWSERSTYLNTEENAFGH